jgi:hypothetical protein
MAPRLLTILTGQNMPKIQQEGLSPRSSTKRRSRISRAWSSKREF